MWYIFRKTLGLFIVAFGLGALFVLILPYWAWIVGIAAITICVGFFWLFWC